jgi:4-amino-4-deoxy-L-arabinose transferase-like glycosyltransferase
MVVRRRLQRAAAAVCFGLCILLVLLIPIRVPFNRYDEGFAVFNAVRVMSGDLPYRDFWAIYPPGQFYALAAVFKLFGTHLLSARLYDTLVRLVIVVCLYHIGLHMMSRTTAWVVSVAAALVLSSVGMYTYAVWPALALGLLSAVALLRYLRGHTWWWLAVSGAAIGLGSLFRLDIGVYAGLSCAAAILVWHLTDEGPRSPSPRGRFLDAARSTLVLLVGFLAVALPCYSRVALHSGLDAMWSQMIQFPLTELHELRWLPYPPLVPEVLPSALDMASLIAAWMGFVRWLRFYLPIVTFVTAPAFLLRSLALRRQQPGTRQPAMVLMTVLGALLFAQAMSRYDYIHVAPSSLCAIVVILAMVDETLNTKRTLVKLWVALLAMAGLVAYVFVPVRTLMYYERGHSPMGCYSDLQRSSCIAVAEDQQQAVAYVRARTREDEPIFVGHQRHDLIVTNDIGFYFLAERASATAYHELYPGVATTLRAQQAIADDIASSDVEFIVLVQMPTPKEPNASAVSSHVHYLDEFIRSRYRRVATFGAYEVWRKQPAQGTTGWVLHGSTLDLVLSEPLG